VAEPTGVLWGQGGMKRKQRCRSGGWGAGGVLADGGDAAVDEVASSGGAWLEAKVRGRQGLGGGLGLLARTLWGVGKDVLGRVNGTLSVGDGVDQMIDQLDKKDSQRGSGG